MTVLEILKKTEDYFKSKDIDNSRLNAELLLCHLLHCKRIDLYLNFDKPLTISEVDRFREFVRRRGLREPLQYITGEGPFRDLTVKVGTGVLIPRQETEILIETLFKEMPDLSGKRILDMGTGSGILAIAVKKKFPLSDVTAVDVSTGALAIAIENGRAQEADIRWACSDMFANLTADRFDVILSNPPYIKRGDLARLDPEVRDHEPRLALDGGEDGLDFYKRFLPEASARLNPGGWVLLEVGEGQAGDVGQLGISAGLILHGKVADLTGKERVVVLEERDRM